MGFIRNWPHAVFDPYVSGQTLRGLKAAIAFGALGLSLYEARRRLAHDPIPQRIVRRVAGLLGAAAVAAYFWGGGGYADSYHPWEFFHYFLGSKYHHELGYSRLYACTAVAQSELAPAMKKEVQARKARNLDTNVLEPAAVALANPDACKSHFTPQRRQVQGGEDLEKAGVRCVQRTEGVGECFWITQTYPHWARLSETAQLGIVSGTSTVPA